jgi:CheY-like chemotaxis protein/HPt (histidine-containing phosphotransfer) domain-containing protein
VHAANGREALQATERVDFDVIFMDIQMPEMDGFEATARIRAMEQTTGRHTPIVAMTAHAITGDRERCLEAGMDEYISKPLEKSQLLELLERFSTARFSNETGIPAAPECGPQTAALLLLPERSPAGEAAPTYSRERLLDELDDDELLMQRMIALFHENTPRLLEDIRSAVARREGDALARSAHALLSSLGAFGADRARHLAEQLEAQAQANDYEHTDQTLAGLERATLEVHTALAAFAHI